MALIDTEKPLAPLSSIADLLNVKQRTLKMYEEKGLLPNKNSRVKKLYSLKDIRKIAFVHFLASGKRVNANGIKYINDILSNYVCEDDIEKLLKFAEESLEKSPNSDFESHENF